MSPYSFIPAPMQYYFEVLKKYAEFNGRARRAEYWMFILVNAIIGMILGILSVLVNPGQMGADPARVISWIYDVIIIVPSIAVGVRRLHDIGKSGWWVLIGLIPIVGAIILILFMIRDGEPGTNQYGPNPKEGAQIPPQTPAAPAAPVQ